MSSANVDVTSPSYVGISAVYGIARVGHRGLACGTPASMCTVWMLLHCISPRRLCDRGKTHVTYECFLAVLL